MALVILSSLLFFALLHSLFPVLNSIPLPYSFCLFIFTSYFLSFLALVLLFIFRGTVWQICRRHCTILTIIYLSCSFVFYLSLACPMFIFLFHIVCVCVPFSSSCFRFVISFLLVKTRTKNTFERIGAWARKMKRARTKRKREEDKERE